MSVQNPTEEWGTDTHLLPVVTFDGADDTSDEKLRVPTSSVRCLMAKKSSKIPAGGVGAS
jgi:hypothetical protein